MSDFCLKRRRSGGATAPLADWGANSDYGVLRDVLLGPVEHFQWLATSSVSKKSLWRGLPFDAEVARKQHAEMVDAYRTAGVDVHMLEADPHLPYQVFARDSCCARGASRSSIRMSR
jgi:N,N dimethylarginine dimethylhydrolase, eukaryotic